MKQNEQTKKSTKPTVNVNDINIKQTSPASQSFTSRLLSAIKQPAFLIFIGFSILAFTIGQNMAPKYAVQKIAIEAQQNSDDQLFYTYKGKPIVIDSVTPIESATLTKENINTLQRQGLPIPSAEFVSEATVVDGQETTLIYQLNTKKHWGIWSLLPAIVATCVCLPVLIASPR